MSEKVDLVPSRVVLQLLSWCKCDLLRSLRMTWLHTVSRQLPAGYPVTRLSTLLSFLKYKTTKMKILAYFFLGTISGQVWKSVPMSDLEEEIAVLQLD